jgi:hypothetical protein
LEVVVVNASRGCFICASTVNVSFNEHFGRNLCDLHDGSLLDNIEDRPPAGSTTAPTSPPFLDEVVPSSFVLRSSSHPAPEDEDEGGEPEVDGLLRRAANGRLEVEPIPLPKLPENATLGMHKVADFFAVVVAVRESQGMPPEVIFAVRWVADWIDLPVPSVARAIKRLVDCGVLVPAGTMALPGRRGTNLYVPGAAGVVVRMGEWKASS